MALLPRGDEASAAAALAYRDARKPFLHGRHPSLLTFATVLLGAMDPLHLEIQFKSYHDFELKLL